MMGHKHLLHELLRQDQEPFQLNTYIADRCCQLRRNPSPKTTTFSHLKKRKPISHNVCFFSFQDSPDVRKSPAKSPCKTPAGNTVFLQIPARTASLLLDAAVRIQKQSSKAKPTESKNVGFGLFGSFLKRLKNNRSKRSEITINGNTTSEEDIEKEKPTRKSHRRNKEINVEEKSAYETGLISCSCNNSRLSSAGWSETNEEKSLDLETSCSSRSHDSEEFVGLERENGGFSASCENCFCSSPTRSPFRFSLQKSPSPSHRTPEFLSPANSPTRNYNQEKVSYEAENLEEVHVSEEEKEQLSPISILDPPFEDDDDEEGHESGDEDEDGYDLECSYASVQRAKQQLLQKLRRFERLAELDPIELEKRMLEVADNEEDEEDLAEEECDNYDSVLEDTNEEFVREVLNHLGIVNQSGKIPSHMKRLVSDIISEENDHKNEEESEVVMKRVCRRLDSWKVVESNTIDMMVELDFRREREGWKRHDQEQMRETGMDIEVAIFGFLIEELSQELFSIAS